MRSKWVSFEPSRQEKEDDVKISSLSPLGRKLFTKESFAEWVYMYFLKFVMSVLVSVSVSVSVQEASEAGGVSVASSRDVPSHAVDEPWTERPADGGEAALRICALFPHIEPSVIGDLLTK